MGGLWGLRSLRSLRGRRGGVAGVGGAVGAVVMRLRAGLVDVVVAVAAFAVAAAVDVVRRAMWYLRVAVVVADAVMRYCSPATVHRPKMS